MLAPLFTVILSLFWCLLVWFTYVQAMSAFADVRWACALSIGRCWDRVEAVDGAGVVGAHIPMGIPITGVPMTIPMNMSHPPCVSALLVRAVVDIWSLSRLRTLQHVAKGISYEVSGPFANRKYAQCQECAITITKKFEDEKGSMTKSGDRWVIWWIQGNVIQLDGSLHQVRIGAGI
ncbi:hypothetical protein F4604DRAFT_1685924 [Suillus subluteus]|nr:hypothetical protein F4604DRAFT_1685924 [Suillus subluteus]